MQQVGQFGDVAKYFKKINNLNVVASFTIPLRVNEV